MLPYVEATSYLASSCESRSETQVLLCVATVPLTACTKNYVMTCFAGNYGRFFFACAQPQAQRCDAFFWADDDVDSIKVCCATLHFVFPEVYRH